VGNVSERRSHALAGSTHNGDGYRRALEQPGADPILEQLGACEAFTNANDARSNRGATRRDGHVDWAARGWERTCAAPTMVAQREKGGGRRANAQNAR
jgi:hypothetical protein